MRGLNTKNHKYGFEKLEVWKSSINFAKSIYKIANKFPPEEKFGLTAQIKRAVISVSSNIVEGSAKKSLKEQARFSEIAYASLLEVLNQLILAFELEFIDENTLNEFRFELENLSKQLNGLKNSQIRRQNEP